MLDLQAGVAYLTFDNTNLLPFLTHLPESTRKLVGIYSEFCRSKFSPRRSEQ